MCDAFLQSFLILVSSPLVSPPYPHGFASGSDFLTSRFRSCFHANATPKKEERHDADAWVLFIINGLCQETYLYDLVDLSRQALVNLVPAWYSRAGQAYQNLQVQYRSPPTWFSTVVSNR
jgi:hypothetical protein